MKKNYIFPILTILLSIFFLIVSLMNPVRSYTFIGPNEWPNIVLTFILIMGVLQFVKTLKENKKCENSAQSTGTENCKEKRDVYLENRHWTILGVLSLYLLLLPYLGFLISTLILTTFNFWLFGMKGKRKIVLLAIASDAFFIVLFAHVLNITLPRGIDMFETLSFIFY